MGRHRATPYPPNPDVRARRMKILQFIIDTDPTLIEISEHVGTSLNTVRVDIYRLESVGFLDERPRSRHRGMSVTKLGWRALEKWTSPDDEALART